MMDEPASKREIQNCSATMASITRALAWKCDHSEAEEQSEICDGVSLDVSKVGIVESTSTPCLSK